MTKPLRIAVLSDTFPPAVGAGIAASHFHWLSLLAKEGCEVEGFAYLDDKALPNTAGESGIRVHRAGPSKKVRQGILRLSRLAFRFLEPGHSAHHLYGIVIAAIGMRALRGPLQRFGPDLVLIPDHNCPGLFLPDLGDAKVLMVAHHNAERFRRHPLLPPMAQRDIDWSHNLERRFIKRVDGIISPSRYMAEVFTETHGEPDCPINVIPNVIDPAIIDPVEPLDLRAKLGLPEDAPLIALPSVGTPLKGSRYVVEIVRRLTERHGPDVGFYLSGGLDAALRFDLDSLADRAKFHLPGRVSARENLAAVKACDVLVSPTLIENFSMAFLEAVCSGVPVVTFDVGGNAELVENGRNGFTVPSLDVTDLVDRAGKVLEQPVAERHAACQAYSRDRFAPGPWVETLLGLA
ncbi:MAG: glycosyltransferase family 4 protein [Magnetovibrionaceae bacterium]